MGLINECRRPVVIRLSSYKDILVAASLSGSRGVTWLWRSSKFERRLSKSVFSVERVPATQSPAASIAHAAPVDIQLNSELITSRLSRSSTSDS